MQIKNQTQETHLYMFQKKGTYPMMHQVTLFEILQETTIMKALSLLSDLLSSMWTLSIILLEGNKITNKVLNDYNYS